MTRSITMGPFRAVVCASHLALLTAASGLHDIHWTNLNSHSHFAPLLENITCQHEHHHDQNQLLLSSSLETCPHTLEPPSLSIPQPGWTYGPDCTGNNITEKLCGYTNPTYLNDRGLAIFTQPSIAQQIVANLWVDEEAFPAEASPPYEVRRLPGKGFGVIANRTIIKGEELFAWPVLGIFRHSAFVWPHETTYEEYRQLIHKSVRNLPQRSQDLIFSLSRHDPETDELLGNLDTNTFAANFGGEDHFVIVPETARMNHDCRPNAIYYLDYESLIHYTHASRTIYAGEEITINYIDPLQSYQARQNAIKNGWGFQCTCSHCTQPSYLRDESDRRIAMIRSLNAEFANDFADSDAEDIAEDVEKTELLVSLLAQERITGGMDDAYRLAAIANKRAGKKWRSVQWAMKSSEDLLITGGPGMALVEEVMGMTDWVEEYFAPPESV